MNILSLIYPCRCPFCHTVIKDGNTACAKCAVNLPKKTMSLSLHSNFKCTAPYPYEGMYRKAILGYKYGKKRIYCKPLAKAISVQRNFDCVTSVPCSADSKRKHGFDHARILAKEVAKNYKTPYESLLIKTRKNKEQHTLSKKERFENVRGAYAVPKKLDIRGKSILLIDDITTTGATLLSCCFELEKAGAGYVECAVIAFTP